MKIISRLGIGLLVVLQLIAAPWRGEAISVMIFCNGDMGTASGLTTAQINGLRASGFNTMVLFAMSVSTNGDFTYGGQTICSGGLYVGPSNWGSLLSQCRTAPSSVNRIEMCIGGSGDTSWANIESLIAADGTNSTTVLYQNLVALKNALGLDAIDSDDESTYDAGSATKFGLMCGSVGLKLTLCPYTDPGYWQSVQAGVGSLCDRIYLQCYSGGEGNDPATWDTYFGGMKVVPGYWDYERDATFLTNMESWSSAGAGGFLWPSCSGCDPPAGPGEMLQYAGWILSCFNDLNITPGTGFSGVSAYNSLVLPESTPFILTNTSDSSLSWSVINTSSWLTVSSLAGTLASGAAMTNTVGLNASVATNMARGIYTATIAFTNQTSGGAVLRNFSLDTAVANWPMALTGFNAALLASNTATAGRPGVTAFDVPNDICFYQQGLSGSTRGLPLNGNFPSQCDSATAFQLGPYGAADALILGYTYARSGTLSLANPEPYNTLAILAASANGGGQGTFVVNFTDGSRSPVFSFNAQDWFYTVTNVAIQGFGRLDLGSSLNVEDNGDLNPNLYETTVNLAALGLAKSVASITFSNPATAGSTEDTAIFAVSGMSSSVPLQAPEELKAIPWTNGAVQLIWNNAVGATNYDVRRALISGGPYTTVGATSGTNDTDSGLANGTTYYYVVSAVGSRYDSANSGEVSAMPGSYESWILADQPLGYWPLNEKSGAVAFDVAGGHNGTYVGGVTPGQAGVPLFGFGAGNYSALFNGTSGYVDIPEGPFNLTNSMTVMAWVNVSVPTHFTGIVGHGDSSWRMSVNTSGEPGGSDGNSSGDATSSTSIAGSNWHMLAYTYSGVTNVANDGALYVDGVLKANNTVGALSGNSLDVWIGGAPDYGTSRLLSGKIAQVAVFTNALSAAQLQKLYNVASNIPPVTLYSVPTGTGNGMTLVWSYGKLLESTNLAGPWITNTVTSPCTIVPTNCLMLFKVGVN